MWENYYLYVTGRVYYKMGYTYLARKAALILLVVFTILKACNADYKIGVGIADCTGPIAEVVFVSTINFLLFKPLEIFFLLKRYFNLN